MLHGEGYIGHIESSYGKSCQDGCLPTVIVAQALSERHSHLENEGVLCVEVTAARHTPYSIQRSYNVSASEMQTMGSLST